VSGSPAGEAMPTDFFCEHTEASSRVLVMLHRPGMSPAAQTVLTDLGPQASEAAASLLRQAAEHGATARLSAEVDTVAASLPAEPAGLLRQAIAQANARLWQAPAHALMPLSVGGGAEDTDDAANDELVMDQDDDAPRLAELAGRVVRVTRLVEMHIPDPQAFLARMRQDGWEPLPADQLPDDDPDDLVGAVQAATDDLPPLPGARPVTDTSIARELDPATGDELLDWSPTPVVVDFGTGWRS
jgi:hypothetical protein